MTYGELKAKLPQTNGMRLPRAKTLRETGSILLRWSDDQGAIELYNNGLFIYTENGYCTVYGLDRCAGIPTENEEGKWKKTVPDETCDGMEWYWPLMIVGAHRLDENCSAREESRIAFHIDCDGNDWEERAAVEDFTAALFAAEDAYENHERLTRAFDFCTDRQKKILGLYFGKEGMTEKKLAEILSQEEGRTISQQGVHKVIVQGLANLKKHF